VSSCPQGPPEQTRALPGTWSACPRTWHRRHPLALSTTTLLALRQGSGRDLAQASPWRLPGKRKALTRAATKSERMEACTASEAGTAVTAWCQHSGRQSAMEPATLGNKSPPPSTLHQDWTLAVTKPKMNSEFNLATFLFISSWGTA
jgi:hypothetical protein